jgi:hypothetical protein
MTFTNPTPPTTPTISGNSLTWTQIATNTVSTGGSEIARLTLFGANASGSATGATTIDFSSETQECCLASFYKADGTDVANGVAQTFVQSPTNSGSGSESSVTFSAASDANNRPIYASYIDTNIVQSPRTNWTEADDLSSSGPTNALETQYRSDAFETTGSATSAESRDWISIGAEIKIAPDALTISETDEVTIGESATMGSLGFYAISESEGLIVGESVSLGMNPLSPVQSFASDGLTIGEFVTAQVIQPDITPVFIGKQETTHEFWLCNQYGQRLVFLDNLIKFEMVKVVNSVGSCSMTLPSNFHESIKDVIGLDYMLEFWRSPTGGSMYLESVFFVRDIVYEEDVRGNDVVILSGPDGNDLLDRRIIGYVAGSSQADKTNQADDMMKEIVRENLGSSATVPARNLTDLNFTVAGDTSSAPSITKGFAWQNVLKVLQDIAFISAENGIYLYFNVVPLIISSSEIGFDFRTYIDQPGQDRTYL